jgi:hypothetical protein
MDIGSRDPTTGEHYVYDSQTGASDREIAGALDNIASARAGAKRNSVDRQRLIGGGASNELPSWVVPVAVVGGAYAIYRWVL